MKRQFLAVGFTVMMMFLAAPGAQAAVVYNITSDHITGGAGTPPFGTVSLLQDGTSVDFTVTLFNGSLFVNTGAGAGQNFLFSATGVAVGDISGTGLTATAGTPLLHADGTGDWMFGVVYTGQGQGGGAGLPGPLTFSVANATIADVIIGNAAGNIFAIDILSGQTGFTGMVDVSTPPVPPIPEPGTMLLLGSGLVGLAGWGRKKFRK